MDGLECCEISLNYATEKFLRLDAEYYQKDYLFLEKVLAAMDGKSIYAYGGKTDCSAFYPSITGHYSNNRENIPFLRVNEIADGLVVITDKTVFLPRHVLSSNSKTMALAYPGDIIIAKGGNTLAKVGLVTDEYNAYATCRDVIILRTNEMRGLNKYYLWAYLHGNFGQKFMWRSASQTGQPHLTLTSIDEIHVPEYSLALQESIEHLYNQSVNLKRESQRKYYAAATLLEKHLGMPQMVEQAVSIKSLSDSFGKTGRLDAEYYQPKFDVLFESLEKHNTRFLGGSNGLVNIKKSIEPGSDAYCSSGIPFVRISDVSKFQISEPEIHLCEGSIDNAHALYPKKDTILFSKDGSVGIAYKLERDESFVTSGALLHLTIKNPSEILPDYLTLVLNSPVVQMQAERDSSGAIIQHWKPSEIESVVIPMLDMDKQKEIASMVQTSFDLRHQAMQLLKYARQAVEMAIAQDEDTALEWLKRQVE
ncbi:MAG: restriction endonuclease subunit S [Oscillospiraceae bacterium]|nr:restriction endonuclease subunit S [Oscillospiraceae bacterium]